MRRVLAAALVALASGCSDRTPVPDSPAPAQRDRPLAPDGTVARAITSTPDRARVQVDLASVRAAVEAYHGEHGAWPRSLDELTLEGRVSYPADLAYDPATGTVSSRAYPSL